MNLGLLDYRTEQRLGGAVSLEYRRPALLWTALSLASGAASAYHGSKRNGGSIGWGVVWGLVGGLFPVITPAIAAAQGFGKCKFDCR